MAKNDRRGDEERGGIGTMTRSRQDQAPAAGGEVTAPAPRRGRQARGVPPQRAFDGQQAAPAGRLPAEPYADPRAADRGGTRQASADPRRTDPRRADQPGADRRRGDPRRRVPRNAAVLGLPGTSAPPPARTGPRPANQAPAGAPWRVAPARRGTGPQPADTARAPRAFLNDQPDEAAQTTPLQPAEQSVVGSHRMPFVLLLCGLLGGALVSALVISTTLAAGSFQITRLQESTSALAKQRQALEQQVAQAKSAQVIAERASKLGMRRAGLIQFIDLKTGKTLSDAGTGWITHAQYPGYTP